MPENIDYFLIRTILIHIVLINTTFLLLYYPSRLILSALTQTINTLTKRILWRSLLICVIFFSSLAIDYYFRYEVIANWTFSYQQLFQELIIYLLILSLGIFLLLAVFIFKAFQKNRDFENLNKKITYLVVADIWIVIYVIVLQKFTILYLP